MAQLEPIAKMVAQLSRLPGVGTKSAQRLAYHIISMPLEEVRELATAIYSGRKSIRYCSVCGNYSTDELCDICRDERRHNGQICVVRDLGTWPPSSGCGIFKGCTMCFTALFPPWTAWGRRISASKN